MKKKIVFLLFPFLLFSSDVFAESSEGTLCATVFTDTTEQPTAFTEFNNGGGTGQGQFGCPTGQMSAKYYAAVALTGEAGLSASATMNASKGAAIDARPCGSAYGACYGAYMGAYSAITSANMANVKAQTEMNKNLAQ